MENNTVITEYKTLRNAFEKTRSTVATASGELWNINMSDIETKLIQLTGRFVENYASDLFITYQRVKELLSTPKPVDEIVYFGLRASGVDHDTFIMSRLSQTMRRPDDYVYVEFTYRHILALRVVVEPATPEYNRPRVTCQLKDITHDIIRLDPEDMNENGQIKALTRNKRN